MIELTFDATDMGNGEFEPTHVGCYELDLNVRSCRRASRSTSTRRPDSSGLPQVIGRQNPARQQRIVRHRLQPRLALRRRPPRFA